METKPSKAFSSIKRGLEEAVAVSKGIKNEFVFHEFTYTNTDTPQRKNKSHKGNYTDFSPTIMTKP